LTQIKAIIILIICAGVIYLNNLRFNSYIIQREILKDINSNTYKKPIEFIEKIDKNYPSLSFTTVPIKAVIGKYLIESTDSIEYGKQLIFNGIKDNPYLSMGEAIIADQYLKESKFDSFRYYSRLAFKKLPNNPINFVLMSNVFKSNKQLDSIIYYFKRISKKVNDFQIYNVVLASLIDEKEYKEDALNILNQGIEKYPNNDQFKVFDQYLKYTKNNIDLAVQLNKNAINLYKNNNVSESILLLTRSIELYPEFQDAIINLFYIYREQEMYLDLTSVYENISFKDIVSNKEITLMYMESLFYLDRFKDACDIQNKIDPDSRLQISRNIKSKCI